MPFTLPTPGGETLWRRLLDTSTGAPTDEMHASGDRVEVPARSLLVLGWGGA